jgi:integrase
MVIGIKKCKKCGTIIPQKKKKYRVVVNIGGKRKTKVVNNLALAKKVELQLENADTNYQFGIKKKKDAVSLKNFWSTKYLPWLKENKKSWYIDRCNFNKHLNPALGENILGAITQFDVEKLVLGLKKKKTKQGQPLSAATIKHQLVLLTRILNIAIQWGIFTGQNPCERVKKPKLNNTVVAYLSNNELDKLTKILDSWPDKMQASIVKFAMFTGVRRNEIFKLEWIDINFESLKMTLRDPKGIKDQILPLSQQAMAVLETVPKEYETKYIFYSVLGKQRKTIRHGWKLIKEAAGLRESFRFHDLRHNYASCLVSNGVSLYTVQALLTHKDAKTTQKYAHLADTTLKQAANLAGDIMTIKPENNNIISMTGDNNGK